MDLKDKNFACFRKKSKKGTDYYSGEVRIDEKLYWISLFEKKSKNGVNYISVVLNEKGSSVEPVQDEEDSRLKQWDEEEIPF